jgi:hypothetical protein
MAKETSITNGILKYLKSLPNTWWMKVHGSAFQVAGVPDIMGLLWGHGVGFEVKVPGNKQQPIQVYAAKNITDGGGMCFVVHSVCETRLVVDLIQSHLDKYRGSVEPSRELVRSACEAELKKIKPKRPKKPKQLEGDTPFG